MSFSRSCRNRVHVRQGDVPNLDILVAPFVEELRLADFLCHVLGQGGELLGRLDFDLAVRHIGDFPDPPAAVYCGLVGERRRTNRWCGVPLKSNC